ncbi:Carboxypeptidase S1-like B [Pseudocercospora fuligena]|uniref:Carboxypeptidase S1-like B n=1 Tax=Pseudocercospora fuligena TaxID=685502 RepID=A0A8H6RB11_9PEZI|nr:Carboxypeptidase S1-like B [Pseudocercospora fuligena]
MWSLPSAIVFCYTLLGFVEGQFISPPTDLKTSKGNLDLPVRWKEVPTGTCEQNPNVKSYSGYVDIATDQHIFFWFFEARNKKPEDAELTVWINGGPGSSSMIGLFQELGPCRVNEDGEVVDNPYAWNNVSNVIFIDQPTQVGFSYSRPISGYQSDSGDIIQLPKNECPDYAAKTGTCGTYSYPDPSLTANSTDNAAPGLWKALQGFMGAFPQYSKTEFNFATESYGGHYGPVFNAYIESQNALIQKQKLPGAKHINLKTVLIGNGWYDARVHYPSYYNFTVHNTYDIPVGNQSIRDQWLNAAWGPGNCHDKVVECNKSGDKAVCRDASSFCTNESENLYDEILGRDEYDIRELTPDPFPPEYYVDYLNSPKLQKAIGAYTNFTESSNTVGNAFGSTGDDPSELNTVEDVRKLVDQGVYVVLYAGDADYICNWVGGEVVSQHVEAPDFNQAGYVNISTSDKIVHGQVKQSANFAYGRIYESGHEVPFYQPLASLELFERAINGLDIATGKTPVQKGCGYKSVGTAKSEYREGNATVQFKVVRTNATYDPSIDGPVLASNGTKVATKKRKRIVKPRVF